MRQIYIIAILVAALFSTISTQAQRRSPRVSLGERDDKSVSASQDVSFRAEELDKRMAQEIGNARWMRIIYRELDLMREENAPLYYPTTPINGQKNLFSTIFQLMLENKIEAYEYMDGYEILDNDHIVKFKELLDRFHILYEEIHDKEGKTSYVINESDIPSADIRSYYVKEAWYFDQNNSVFDVKIMAICPILTSAGDIGETTMPMFWLPYENIYPYINRSYIMVSNINNSMTFTIDDYFRRRMFKGDIIKTQNLLNRPIQAYCPTPDSLKREQERIEKELTNFENALWHKSDTTATIDKRKATKSHKKNKTSKKNNNDRLTPTKSVRYIR